MKGKGIVLSFDRDSVINIVSTLCSAYTFYAIVLNREIKKCEDLTQSPNEKSLEGIYFSLAECRRLIDMFSSTIGMHLPDEFFDTKNACDSLTQKKVKKIIESY